MFRCRACPQLGKRRQEEEDTSSRLDVRVDDHRHQAILRLLGSHHGRGCKASERDAQAAGTLSQRSARRLTRFDHDERGHRHAACFEIFQRNVQEKLSLRCMRVEGDAPRAQLDAGSQWSSLSRTSLAVAMSPSDEEVCGFGLDVSVLSKGNSHTQQHVE